MMTPFTLVIFGITGNLAQLKLLPALYDLEIGGFLPAEMSVIGLGRTELTQEMYREYLSRAIRAENRHHHHPIDDAVLDRLLKKIHYIAGTFTDPKLYGKIHELAGKAAHPDASRHLLFYLATYPDLYETIFTQLQKSDLIKTGSGWLRILIEKPIGSDLKSAKKLDNLLHRYFTEDQIFRLDHYLGKETIQNILTFRFGDGLFEPLMDRYCVDHIQVTAAEEFGIGLRGGYYDSVGCLKDVGQNHLLQMVAFAMMDTPTEWSNDAITYQRAKALRQLRPDAEKIVFGQYAGYTSEKNVNPQSKRDTFFALKTHLSTPRWRGVPIYIRAGKKLAQSVTEISIVFKPPKNRLHARLTHGQDPAVLTFRIQPNEGIVLKILTKKPGHTLMLEPNFMQFCYKHSSPQLPEAYERLLQDAIQGDQTFFNDAREVEAQWKFIEPFIQKADKPLIYQAGSWGPAAANELLKADGREWIEPSMAFCN